MRVVVAVAVIRAAHAPVEPVEPVVVEPAHLELALLEVRERQTLVAVAVDAAIRGQIMVVQAVRAL